MLDGIHDAADEHGYDVITVTTKESIIKEIDSLQILSSGNVDGVIIDGTVKLAGTMSFHASQLYAKNVSAFILHGYDKEKKEFNLQDEIMIGSMFTHNGKIVDERTKNIIEGSN